MEVLQIINIVASAISAFIAILAFIISIASWRRSRAIYGLEEMVLRKHDGGEYDSTDDRNLGEIDKKLSSGEYTIESIYERRDGDLGVLLAKIKK